MASEIMLRISYSLSLAAAHLMSQKATASVKEIPMTIAKGFHRVDEVHSVLKAGIGAGHHANTCF